MTTGCSHPYSRAGALRRLRECYPTATEALSAGDYYVAARRADALPEVRAAALALAGFHEAAHVRFRALRPSLPLAIFAKALTLLFVEGRQAALTFLAAPGTPGGAPAALHRVLAQGRVTVNFVTAWQHWLDRVHFARAGAESHGLDLKIRTISCRAGADIQLDFNGNGFAERTSAGDAHAVNLFFDELDLLPRDFHLSRLPNIKMMMDYHHHLARQHGVFARFDHLIPYDSETHQRLRRMFGRAGPMLVRMSDMVPVPVFPSAVRDIDLLMSGSLIADYSPRRGAFLRRAVEEAGEGARLILVDGRMTGSQYGEMTGRARAVPALLEIGNGLPSPRAYEALNSGGTVIVDDPEFFRCAWPERAHQFLDVETALVRLRTGRSEGTAPDSAAVGSPDGAPLPPSELPPVDQMLHLALVAPLAGAPALERRAAGPPRLLSERIMVRHALVAQNGMPELMQRAVALAAGLETPLAALDGARYFAEVAGSCRDRAAAGRTQRLEPALERELSKLVRRAADGGWRPPALDRSMGESGAAASTLAMAAFAVLHDGRLRFPHSLIIAYDELRLLQDFATGESIARAIAEIRRAGPAMLRYDPLNADPFSVGQPLSDQLAIAILEDRISQPAQLQPHAEAAIWRLVDLAEARLALCAGAFERAGALTRAILAGAPRDRWAGDLLLAIWRQAPAAAYGGTDGRNFGQALQGVLEVCPARMEAYAPALVTVALQCGDAEAAARFLRMWRLWQTRLHRHRADGDARAAELQHLEREAAALAD